LFSPFSYGFDVIAGLVHGVQVDGERFAGTGLVRCAPGFILIGDVDQME
jgi:hypothetical protein